MRADARELTDIAPSDGGGYWFAYGRAKTVGHVGGRLGTHSVHLAGLRELRAVAPLGSDLLVDDGACVLGRIDAFALVEAAQYDAPCAEPRPSPPLTATSDGAVWLLDAPHSIVRIDPDRTRRAWPTSYYPRGVAVARDGTAYVLAMDAMSWQAGYVVIAIPRDGEPQVRTLPMRSAASIAVDGRDRIWITDPRDHAAIVVAPPGAWG